MIATLNSSDVLAFKMNVFNYFNSMMPYTSSYNSYDYNNYISQPDSYKYNMNYISSK